MLSSFLFAERICVIFFKYLIEFASETCCAFLCGKVFKWLIQFIYTLLSYSNCIFFLESVLVILSFLGICLFCLSCLSCWNKVVDNISLLPFNFYRLINDILSFIPNLVTWIFSLIFLVSLCKSSDLLKNSFWFHSLSLLFLCILFYWFLLWSIIFFLLLALDLICFCFYSFLKNLITLFSSYICI